MNEAKVPTCAERGSSADGLPDNLGGSQSTFERQCCTPYCVRDGLPPTTPDCCVDQATFRGQTSSVTSGALAIHYNGPIELIPVISSLTCAFWTKSEHPCRGSCITFQSSLPPPAVRSFQLLTLLSLRGFVDMFSQGQVNVTLPQFIH
jgi:hypothetical protein